MTHPWAIDLVTTRQCEAFLFQMGITGLLPYLKNASRKAHISEFKGCTAAIDSYCWLHKGAFACAEKLALGEDTDQ